MPLPLLQPPNGKSPLVRFLLKKGLLDAAGCEAACDYIWRRAPGFIDRNRPETWLDPHERWTPSGGRTGSSFNVSTARICRHAGV